MSDLIDPVMPGPEKKKDKNPTPFDEPITVKLTEVQLKQVLRHHFEKYGYTVCESKLDFSIDAGEKEGEVVLCGNGIPCRCAAQEAAQKKMFDEMGAGLATPKLVTVDPDDDLME